MNSFAQAILTWNRNIATAMAPLILLSVVAIPRNVKAANTATDGATASSRSDPKSLYGQNDASLAAISLDEGTTSSWLTSNIELATTPSTPALEHIDFYWGDDVGNPNGYSLREVMQIAAKANPNWATFAANHAAAHAELIKALAFPNPELEVELGRATSLEKDESGRKPTRSTYDLGLSQPIELPGKRAAREAEAMAGFAVATGEAFEFNSALRAEVIEAYYTVQYHAALGRLWQTLLDVTEQLQSIASKRVQLGEAGRIEALNARVEKLKAKRERDAALRRKLGAMASLNALAGGRLGRDFALSDSLPRLPQPAKLSDLLQSALACHPRLIRLKAELEQKYASIDRQRTEWWPDVKLGVHKSREFDSKGVAATVGIEIPLWNRNQGGVAAAEAAAQKTYAQIMIACNEIHRDVEVAYQNLEIAREQIASYEDGLKSASEEAVELAYLQYREGATGYLDVLTARRLLQETEQGYIQARFDAATAMARLDRADGKYIEQEPRNSPVHISKRASGERNNATASRSHSRN
jgi:cobalt-zinc-cadmium efflux system outer membrane protein